MKCYWSLDSNGKPVPGSREKIFPDGCIELLFNFGDVFRKYGDEDHTEIQPRSFVHGQIRKFIEVQPTGHIGIFAVRFHPSGLQPFLAFGADELTEQNIEVRDIWGKDGDILVDRILNAVTDVERIRVLENFLLSRLEETTHTQARIDYCVHTIVQSAGMVTVDQLAEETGIGRRYLERGFMARVGLSPKVLSRIIRFQNVLQMIERKQFSTMTLLAYEGGFYDQAHFIRDFREFTGMSPKAYFSEDLELTRYFANG